MSDEKRGTPEATGVVERCRAWLLAHSVERNDGDLLVGTSQATAEALAEALPKLLRVTNSAPRVTPEDWAKLHAMKAELDAIKVPDVGAMRSTSAPPCTKCEQPTDYAGADLCTPCWTAHMKVVRPSDAQDVAWAAFEAKYGPDFRVARGAVKASFDAGWEARYPDYDQGERAALLEVAAAAYDVLDVRRLSSDQVMMDRHRLRQAMRALEAAQKRGDGT